MVVVLCCFCFFLDEEGAGDDEVQFLHLHCFVCFIIVHFNSMNSSVFTLATSLCFCFSSVVVLYDFIDVLGGGGIAMIIDNVVVLLYYYMLLHVITC